MRSYNPKLAVFFSLGAAFLYSVMGLLIKFSEAHVPSEMIVFFRQFVSFLLVIPLLFFEVDAEHTLKTNRFHLHLLRVFASLSAMYCLVYAIKYLPLVDALLLSYTRPLFIPLVIYFWFGKKLTRHSWLGLLIGFFGVLFILKPHGGAWDIATLVGLASGMFGAVAFTTIRRLTKTEFADKILFYYVTLSIPIAAIPLITNWQPLTLQSGLLLLSVGAAGMLYEMFLTRAYRHAKAFKVGSLLYSTIIFGAMFDWMMGNSFFDIFCGIGMLLIIIGSIISLRAPIPAPISKDGKS